MSAWVLLGIAVVAEVGATIALRMSHGLTRPAPTIAVLAGYGLAFWLLSRIVQQLPASVTYAVWAGAGVALVSVVGTVWFGEAMTATKLVSLVLVVLGVVGLNLYGGGYDDARHGRNAAGAGATVVEADLPTGERS